MKNLEELKKRPSNRSRTKESSIYLGYLLLYDSGLSCYMQNNRFNVTEAAGSGGRQEVTVASGGRL